MPSAKVQGIFPKLIIPEYSDRVLGISMSMEGTHWSCTAEAVMMMRTHSADSGFCYSSALQQCSSYTYKNRGFDYRKSVKYPIVWEFDVLLIFWHKFKVDLIRAV